MEINAEYLQVVSNDTMDAVLTAITDELGFRLRELEVIFVPHRYGIEHVSLLVMMMQSGAVSM